MKSGERETYLPGSGYNEGSSNNGSGHGGFPLLMFVPFSLFFSGYWLVRPLFLGLFVPCSCFQSLLFCFLALVLCLLRLFFLCVPLVLFLFTLSPLLFLFRLCLSPLSRSVFSFSSCSHMLCLSLSFFLFLALFWVEFSSVFPSDLSLPFLGLFLCFIPPKTPLFPLIFGPFYRDPAACL
jgi:hypothetical protein